MLLYVFSRDRFICYSGSLYVYVHIIDAILQIFCLPPNIYNQVRVGH